jgi:hypothetical protein
MGGHDTVDRREFLQGAGIAAGLALGSGLGASPAQAGSFATLHRVLVDTRAPESRAFGAEAARHGVALTEFDGDITNFWVNELDMLWRDRPAALAGLTHHGAFFCLERLAMDRGLRVSFKADHRVQDNNTRHEIAAAGALIADPVLGALATDDWPTRIAALALSAPRDGPAAARTIVSGAAAAGQTPFLVSWVIAPKYERLGVEELGLGEIA